MIARLARVGFAVSVAWTAAATADDGAPPPADAPWSFALHGGAGVIQPMTLTAEEEAGYRQALKDASVLAIDILSHGGASLDAVEAAVRRLEDDPRFNAGRGAVFTADGEIELDASMMDGRTRAAGAVAGVKTVKNPITLARTVMERSPHVFLSGDGAEAFAAQEGLALVSPEYFRTEERWKQLQARLSRGEAIPRDRYGTVGAVAMDQYGHYAAATSTGGMTAEMYGRIGDAPIIGAGTYAQDGVCAVSSTGWGEYFIRLSVARTICARIEFLGEDVEAASAAVIQQDLASLGGDGGVIVIGRDGQTGWNFNTIGMYRARATHDTPLDVAIYGEPPAGTDETVSPAEDVSHSVEPGSAP